MGRLKRKNAGKSRCTSCVDDVSTETTVVDTVLKLEQV